MGLHVFFGYIQVNTNRILWAQVPLVVIFLLPFIFSLCGWLGAASPDVEATITAGVAATRQAETNLQATIAAAVSATQVAQPAAATSPQLTPPAGLTALPDLEQVRQVILDEVNAAIAQDLALLQALYAPDAVIIDHSGTPANPDDDSVWRGWASIEQRYTAFFSAGFTSLTLVDLSLQIEGDRATATHQGVVLDGTFYPDQGVYTLQKKEARWLITRLEYGNDPQGYGRLLETPPPGSTPGSAGRDDGLYELAVGSQHRYEEPWGWDRGEPCRAWETGDFDDTKPNYRGFNVELLLTNHTTTKVPDGWPVLFITHNGKNVQACYYGYEGSGPAPGATSSVTFFTVVEKGDYVEKIIFSLNDQTIQLCLDGRGGWRKC